jgi:hypothetical protein
MQTTTERPQSTFGSLARPGPHSFANFSVVNKSKHRCVLLLSNFDRVGGGPQPYHAER